MALSLLCSRTGGEIEGAEAVRKSFPDYWSRLQSLGIPITLTEGPKVQGDRKALVAPAGAKLF